MKFTIDRDFATLSEVDGVKEAIKVFKAQYTENDLVTEFECSTDEWINGYYKVVKAEANVFPTGWKEEGRYNFHIRMTLECFEEFAVIDFYMNDEGTIDTKDYNGRKLWKLERYKLVKE